LQSAFSRDFFLNCPFAAHSMLPPGAVRTSPLPAPIRYATAASRTPRHRKNMAGWHVSPRTGMWSGATSNDKIWESDNDNGTKYKRTRVHNHYPSSNGAGP